MGSMVGGMGKGMDNRGKGQGNWNMKGGFDNGYGYGGGDWNGLAHSSDGTLALRGPGPGPGPCGKGGSSSSGRMALKVLISSEEVAVLGKDPIVMQQIQQATNTVGILSAGNYPGSNLQELTIQGPSLDSVFTAILHIYTRLGEVLGTVRSGEIDIPPGDARIKLVIPKRAAAAVIGSGGNQVKALKASTGIRISIDTNSVPCGSSGIMEQALCLIGPLNCMQPAIELVAKEVGNFTTECWFHTWANHSNAGAHMPGMVLFKDMITSRGKGKGKDGQGDPGRGDFVGGGSGPMMSPM